jgi:hypothetical protein
MTRKHFPALGAALMLILMLGLPDRNPTPPVEAAQTSAIDRELMGMVVRDPWYEVDPITGEPNRAAQDQMGAILARTGVRWVRLEFIIEQRDGESVADAFERNISRYDYFIDQVAPRHNLKVLGLLSFGLMAPDPRDPNYGLLATDIANDPKYGGAVNFYIRTWLDRALQIAQRYEDRVAAYQILNEHNRLPVSPGYGGGEGLDPVVVGRLHTKFYRCFKQNECDHTSNDPAWRAGVQVITGGLHPRGSDSIVVDPDPKAARLPGITDRAYLRAVYDSDGFQGYSGGYPLDGIGVHPYPVEIRASLQTISSDVGQIELRLDQLRSVLSPAEQKPFWITELGYDAGYPRQTEHGQAAFLRESFTRLAARDDIARIFWFKYEDFPGNAIAPNKWGIVRIPFQLSSTCPGGACYPADGVPEAHREAYLVYRELAGLPNEQLAFPIIRR